MLDHRDTIIMMYLKDNTKYIKKTFELKEENALLKKQLEEYENIISMLTELNGGKIFIPKDILLNNDNNALEINVNLKGILLKIENNADCQEI